ncbi:MAG: hypothetical protein JRJ49_10120 [Deltaproteobacteria bacterium]|jgi:hypothetical protein|nr:hypothetical protein [Deltaproteobacteria bacterium]
MKTLYICKSKPEDTTNKFMEIITPDKSAAKIVSLSEKDINWDSLVDDIFSYDKVICWW